MAGTLKHIPFTLSVLLTAGCTTDLQAIAVFADASTPTPGPVGVPGPGDADAGAPPAPAGTCATQVPMNGSVVGIDCAGGTCACLRDGVQVNQCGGVGCDLSVVGADLLLGCCVFTPPPQADAGIVNPMDGMLDAGIPDTGIPERPFNCTNTATLTANGLNKQLAITCRGLVCACRFTASGGGVEQEIDSRCAEVYARCDPLPPPTPDKVRLGCCISN